MKFENYNFWDQNIINVLKYYVDHKNERLFAITGDIDRLGLYVSKYGRARAENLVDLYNKIIETYLKERLDQHPQITSSYFAPSGEEIFFLATTNNRTVAKELCENIERDVNKLMKQNPFISLRGTAISFGYKFFGEKSLLNSIKELIRILRKGEYDKVEVYRRFIKLTLAFREALAFELDRGKFSDVHKDRDQLVFLLRNIVYYKLQRYKYETRELVCGTSERYNNHNLGALTKVYGLNKPKIEKLEKFLDSLS